MIQKVALNRLKIEYVVVWGMGLDILVHQIFEKKSYGFTTRLKYVPRTPKLDSIHSKSFYKGDEQSKSAENHREGYPGCQYIRSWFFLFCVKSPMGLRFLRSSIFLTEMQLLQIGSKSNIVLLVLWVYMNKVSFCVCQNSYGFTVISRKLDILVRLQLLLQNSLNSDMLQFRVQ